MSVKVGDIVRTKNKEGKVILSAVVTRVETRTPWGGGKKEEVDRVEVLFSDGTHCSRGIKNIEKTSRYIDVQSVLDSIK